MRAFKPLRRKIGVLTLVMASVLSAGWVCGLAEPTEFTVLNLPEVVYYVQSSENRMTLIRERVLDVGVDPHPAELFSVRCWSVIPPLTLLSAWLLLSKSRVKERPPSSESPSSP